jgi:acetylornithine/succinyldiaminopimelate/putrescine aminotransferase
MNGRITKILRAEARLIAGRPQDVDAVHKHLKREFKKKDRVEKRAYAKNRNARLNEAIRQINSERRSRVAQAYSDALAMHTAAKLARTNPEAARAILQAPRG